MSRTINILSLGAGVQSTTLLLMSCLGELPKLDAAIFADTKWEPAAVYKHLEWLEVFTKQHGIPLIQVSKGDLRHHTMNGVVRGSKTAGERYATLPLRVLNTDGSDGMIRRQCTREYKIEPIERWIKTELLGLKPRGRWPKVHTVDQWLGISADEPQRMRTSDKVWTKFVYPLCGIPDLMLGRTVNREGCVAWLTRNFPDITVPRSACIGCPFHSNSEWRALKRNPVEWADAVEVDEAIRHADGRNGTVYLHRSCTPLATAPLGDDPNQYDFGWGNECLGYCGS